jgi:hypothetical protein
VVAYRTLHRFAAEECGFTGRRARVTVRVADGEPGVECQVDFAQLGYLDAADPRTGELRRRKVHALILTAVLSRHMYVHLSHSQTLADVIAGCQAAWVYFGGVFKVLVPDNLKPVVAQSDAVNPSFTTGWLDYAQHAGFATEPARVRSPQDKDRVAYCTSSGRCVGGGVGAGHSTLVCRRPRCGVGGLGPGGTVTSTRIITRRMMPDPNGTRHSIRSKTRHARRGLSFRSSATPLSEQILGDPHSQATDLGDKPSWPRCSTTPTPTCP